MAGARKEINMTEGNPVKLILQFAVPVFLSQLFQQLYNIADSLIVGNLLGKKELAAVSSSGPLIFLLTSFFSGVALGAGVVISRHFGAGNLERMKKAIHMNVMLGFASGILMSIVGVLLTPQILQWMGTDPAVLPNSISYFRFYFMGALAVIMYNIFTGIMNAVGDSRRPLQYLIFSSILNVILDLILISIFKKVWAAAFATTVAQGISALLCLKQLLRKGSVYQLEAAYFRFQPDLLSEILKMGLPTGIQNSVIGFANVIVQSNINSFGQDAMAGYGSYVKIEGFAFLPITCFSMAMTTYIGQNLGAKKYDRAKQGARFGILTSVTLAELIGVITYVFAPALIAMFSRDSEVIRYGVTQARTVSLFFCLLAFSHCVAGICRGAGKAVIPMVIMFSIWCVLRITYIVVMMHYFHKIQFIYWAYPLTWGLSSVIYLIYYKCCDWVHGFETSKKLF